MKIIRIFLLFIIFFIPVAGIITTPSDLVLKGENRNITAFPEFGKNLFFLNLQNKITRSGNDTCYRNKKDYKK